MAATPTPEEIKAYSDEVNKIADRDGISFEQAAKNFTALLTNIKENDEIIYTLRIAFEDLIKRVEALEAKV